MIESVLKLLALYEFYGISESIEIAKGKYSIPKSFKHAYKQGKRLGHGN